LSNLNVGEQTPAHCFSGKEAKGSNLWQCVYVSVTCVIYQKFISVKFECRWADPCSLFFRGKGLSG